ncbi:MAG TPA: undecaprenyl-phosphate glucose phosphotransferase [Burkholderiales bacterium]|nr:undecaprenyl-phosphate glucose phosphotransferase [Burkholderiales bacterium]
MTSPLVRILRNYSLEIEALSLPFDVLLIWLSLDSARWIFDVGYDSNYGLASIFATTAFFLIGLSQSIYASWRLASFKRMSLRVLLIWMAIVILLISLAFFTRTSDGFSRIVMLTWFFVTPVMLISERLFLQTIIRHFRSQGRNTQTVAIAGACTTALRIMEGVSASDWMGLNLVGVYDDRKAPRSPLSFNGKPIEIRGSLADLVEEAKAGRIDHVYIALPMSAEKRIVDLINALSDTTASFFVVPDLFVFNLMHARWINMYGIPMVSIFETPFYDVDGWFKRIEDIVLGTMIVALILIPMILISIGVKLSSPGPVIFRQRRYGLNGKVVEVWKFRSMTVCEDGNDVRQAKKNDTRITKFGAFLRKTSLDELPQFINVLQGHMSIVGPRPHAVSHNELYRKLIHGYMLRHKVKPGITGWAQINGWRGETDTLEKMSGRIECDLYYIQNWSLWLDIRIILLTLFRGFVGKYAY